MKKTVFNPYLPSWEYVPDGEPRVFGDRLYVYGSHDAFNGADFCVNDYVCWSAPLDDLGDWRCEGVIYRAAQDPRNKDGKMHMCAPDCVQGPDGRYYLYYQLHVLTCTSVAVADSPIGPFEHYGYVQHLDGTPWGEKKGDSFAFDPGVLVDEDGRVYCYVGFSPLGFLKSVFKLRGNRVEESVCLELDRDMRTVRGGEHPIVPGHALAKGTEYEGHAFFEASSIRKIGSKYYYVYSSELSHELCYAVSDRPDGGFRYGGTLVSIADLGYKGNAKPLNYTGNTHGGMVELGGQWYIFYHRQTNKQKCARQGCADKLKILTDGSIPQVEVTSCGLNDGPLPGKGSYEARIACNLFSTEGTFPYLKTHEKDKNDLHPYFTQSGGDRERDGDQYIANLKNGATAGFKYFELSELRTISVTVRGSGEGFVSVAREEGGRPIAAIPISPTADWQTFSAKTTDTVSGISALFFRFFGSGALDFKSFELQAALTEMKEKETAMAEYERNHLAALREHLAECTVLLKTNGAFPLSEPCRIAAYGSGVRNTVKGGTGSGEVNSRFFVNVEDGLTHAGFTVTTRAWLDAYDQKHAEAKSAFIEQLKVEAKAAKTNVMIYGMGKVMPEPEYELPLDAPGEAAIYVLSRVSGEGNDRKPICGDVKLNRTEVRDVLALNRRFEKFMLVLNVGGPVDLSEVQDVGNILVLSQLGVETGAALADILLGKENPSGRLTTTWAAWEDYPQIGDFGDHDDTCYREGVYVGYRYFDSVGKKPLYPFGFGLSYTRFEQNLESVRLDGSTVTANVTVTNTGTIAGKDVVQLYLCPPQSKLDKPMQSLAGFGKTKLLASGESETLEVIFDLRDQTSYDEARCVYILEKGDYLLRTGKSSSETVDIAVIRVEEEIALRQVRKALGKPDFADWKPEKVNSAAIDVNLPVLTLDKGELSTEMPDYDPEEEIDATVKALSDEELSLMNVGAFDPKGGIASVIGNASSSVAGAAGETASVLKAKGIPSLVMADGPAGLRLTKEFYRDEKGAHGIGAGGLPESIAELMPAPIRWLSGLMGGNDAPKGTKIEAQYCTAIPIGTAIAQSWNLDFARTCGDIVGDEMERFGVHLWLAPALNIHRCILCGRNYEYFSEDPLISGKMAAAMTDGVQAHAGCGVTIKHFAANNQEYNRYGNNSLVSERAMREIYLRCFEICIRESHPHALMTSYNLLNSVHAAERRDLIQDILRSEFGFDGIVMTDWWASSQMISKQDKHPAVQPHLVAAASGELFMPGSKKDYKEILKALKSGAVSRKQLEINATHVCQIGRKLSAKNGLSA